MRLVIQSIAVLLLIVSSSALAQDKPKLPISASSKTLGYSPLWVASKLGFFDQQGLDVELVLVNGADKSTMALMGGSVYVSSGVVDTVIAAVEQGRGSRDYRRRDQRTHPYIMAAKRFKSLRGSARAPTSVRRG